MTKRFILGGIMFATCFVAFLSTIHAVQGQQFKAGAAAVDITPTHRPVITYSRNVDKIEEPIYARALVLDDGTTKFAFAVVDVCLLHTEVIEKIKDAIVAKTDLKRDRICLSTTHTHTCPAAAIVHAGVADEKFIATLPEKVSQALVQANAKRVPARIGWGTAREPRYVFCRRYLMKPGTALTIPSEFSGVPRDLAMMNPGQNNPNIVSRTGVPDQTIYVIGLQTLDGKPLAVLGNYSTHYAGHGAPAISADYFGVFCREISKLLDAPNNFVALMTNGTSGDTNCCDFLSKTPPEYNIDLVGKAVAEGALRAWKQMKFYDHVPFTVLEEKLNVAIRKPTDAQVALAKEHLKKLEEKGKKFSNWTDKYAFETVYLSTLPPRRDIKLQTIRIGSLAICAIPSEVYSFTGHDLRANSPFTPTFVISLANGYNGYLPTADSFQLGGYTTWRTRSSLLEEPAEAMIRAKLTEMLQSLKQE
ncbi:MAG: hypothetical protein PHQ75_02255 [Thermoguttaceae bacterium]|nr:hypothetical protein [Thermoguttaceae bacterium]